MNHSKIFQVTYRSPRNTLETFWAEDSTDFGQCIRFTGCRIKCTVTSKRTSMNYHEPLESITIPSCLASTTHLTDQPEWWQRILKEATREPSSECLGDQSV